MSDLSEQVNHPEVARALLRSLMRDLRIQLRNGLPVPDWAQPVMTSLAAAADVNGPVIGTTIANLASTSRRNHYISVTEAAGASGLSPEYIRRLVRTGRVIGQRVGQRTWLIDMDSLKGVIGNAQQDRAS